MVDSDSSLSGRLSLFIDKSFVEEPLKVVYDGALQFLCLWAENRGIFSHRREAGFLTKEILSVMLLVVFKRGVMCDSPMDNFRVVSAFFALYSTWKFVECGVATQCGGLENHCGSLISDEDGLDSDCDEEIRGKRLAARNRDVAVPDGASLSTRPSDENDEVHPHKRLRFELGQIRDLRRFYDVEIGSHARKIGLGEHAFEDKLDYVDAVSVMHPCDSSVNLGIQILESHKKLIVQELARAHMLLSDCVGDSDAEVFSLLSARVDPRRGAGLFVIFQIEAETEELVEMVSSVVQDQNWFLIQETQAFAGVMVVPFAKLSRELWAQIAPQPSMAYSGSIVTGFSFPKEYPYCASEGLQLDFCGPMSRVLLRARQILKEMPEFEEKFAHRFSVRCAIRIGK